MIRDIVFSKRCEILSVCCELAEVFLVGAPFFIKTQLARTTSQTLCAQGLEKAFDGDLYFARPSSFTVSLFPLFAAGLKLTAT